jgi:SAM-dependent methyltransferase
VTGLALRIARKLLKTVDVAIESRRVGVAPMAAPTNGRTTDIEQFLSRIQHDSPGAQAYFERHSARLARTLSFVPTAQPNEPALELGSYLHMAAALEHVLGYSPVKAAYYATEPGADRKSLQIAGLPPFVRDVDLFDVEKHSFPYRDGEFRLVLCCELIEHLLHDPMHMLVECNRVLGEGGLLLVTTPNVVSFTSVACVLHGWRNPQSYAVYPAPGSMDSPHVREYTPSELSRAIQASGFEIESLFTERIAGVDEGPWVQELLEQNGFDTSLRGEQMYCLARKRSGLPIERYPAFLYAV